MLRSPRPFSRLLCSPHLVLPDRRPYPSASSRRTLVPGKMLEVMAVMAVSLLDNGQPSGREFNPGLSFHLCHVLICEAAKLLVGLG
jgi:hypothetical protein